MPELSRFFGIIIRMYLEAGGQHSLPHFYAYYQGDQAVFTIEPVGMIEGSFPNRHRRLVEACREIPQEELQTAWHALQSGRLPGRIEPLN